MDFFERQDDARRRTRRLVLLFGLSVIAIIAVLYTVAWSISTGAALRTTGELKGTLWDGELLLSVALAALVVIGTGSLFKVLELRGGGDKVARLLGGRPIDVNTSDLDERRLLNVVEEMALASGVPVPPVYVLERERAVNAFAAGFTPADAVIGVTRGSLRLLDREELQGVIAHEFSHILNGDMRLNLRLIGVLHGILAIAIIGRLLLRGAQFGSSGDSRRAGAAGALAAMGVALWLIGSVGAFFGRWIKSAVSRQREYLADASAVQFTRNPMGLAEALKTIGGLSFGALLRTPRAEEVSHMFFGDAMGHSLFSTHPPLIERVQRLDPGFDGTFPKVEVPEEFRAEEAVRAAEVQRLRHPLQGGPRLRRPGVMPEPATLALLLTPEAWLDGLGNLDQDHIEYAAQLLAALPDPVRTAAREPSAARAVVLGLLMDSSLAIRDRQLALIQSEGGEELARETTELGGLIAPLSEEVRLPLLDLVVPALARMSGEQYDVFISLVRGLITADDKISLFEYSLQRSLERHLRPRFRNVVPPVVQYYSLKSLDQECSAVLGALAWCGAGPEGARASFDRGSEVLQEWVSDLKLPPEDATTLQAVDEALAQLRLVAPRLKRPLLHAAATAVANDAAVTVEEGELLRAIADALDTPAPPLLPGQRLTIRHG